jgi:hypothetical protein
MEQGSARGGAERKRDEPNLRRSVLGLETGALFAVGFEHVHAKMVQQRRPDRVEAASCSTSITVKGRTSRAADVTQGPVRPTSTGAEG